MEIAQQIEDRLGQGYHLSNLSEAFAFLGRYADAIRCGNESAQISSEVQNSVFGTWSRWALALAYLMQDDL